MTERRYGEREVREIFARAAEAGAEASGGPARAHGLTLRELQDMGLEAGLGPEHVARAAAALDAGTEVLPRRRWMGLPVAVGRIVPLPRELTDREWAFLVSELRLTFDARGHDWSRPDRREWSDDNLHAVIEDAPTGPRLRLGVHKRESVDWALIGVGPLAGALGLVGLALATGSAWETLLIPAPLGLAGAAVIAYNVGGLPRWANQHERRMAHIAEWTRDLLADPLDAEEREPDEGEDETRADETLRVASG